MPVIKVYLDDEEFAPIARLAAQLHVKPEDVVFAGLNRVMLNPNDPDVRAEITDSPLWRHDNLPRWSDSARSVHAYEGKADDYSEPSL